MTKYQQKIIEMISQLDPMNNSNQMSQSAIKHVRNSLILAINNYPDYISRNLHPDWVEAVNKNNPTRSSRKLNLTSYPIVETYYRWKSALWLDVPFFSCQMLANLWESVLESTLKAGIASYYLHDLSQHARPENSDRSNWITHKLPIDRSRLFEQELIQPVSVSDYEESIKVLNTVVKEYTE